MAAQPGTVILHSAERRWRSLACVLLAIGAVWEFAWRHPQAPGIALGCVLGLGLLAVAWRVSRTCVVVDRSGLADHRLVRVIRVRWTDIADFEVARPAGPWGGFCIRAIRHDGDPVDLLATRGYALLPSPAGYDNVHRMMWTLAELRPADPV